MRRRAQAGRVTQTTAQRNTAQHNLVEVVRSSALFCPTSLHAQLSNAQKRSETPLLILGGGASEGLPGGLRRRDGGGRAAAVHLLGGDDGPQAAGPVESGACGGGGGGER